MRSERGAGLLVEVLLLTVPVAAMASSVIFLRLSELGAGEVSGWRLALGGFVLVVLFGGGGIGRGQVKKSGGRRFFSRGGNFFFEGGVGRAKLVVFGGILLGFHFVTWVEGARMTSAANATLLVNLVPLVLPWFLLWMAAEPARAGDWLGSGLGISGVAVVVWAGGGEGGTLAGDALCLGSMLLLAAYMALGRRAAAVFPGTAAWVAPVFLIAAVVCFGVEWAVHGRLGWPPAGEWIWIGALVVFPTILGHGLMNRALRVWRGQVVGVATTGQFLFAGLLAWWVFGEVPGVWFPVGAGLVVAGVWVVGRGRF